MDITRREEIIDAFIKIGSRKGLDNTTMQDIAKEVGISVGAIYLHFKNKEELIDAFGKHIFQELDFYNDQILSQSAPAEKLLFDLTVGEVAFMSKHIRKNQSLFDLFHHDAIKHIKKKNFKEKRFQIENQRTKIIEKVLEQGIREGNFEIENISLTAKMIFMAYGSPHFHGPDVIEREHEEVVSDAEAMYHLLLKSIKK